MKDEPVVVGYAPMRHEYKTKDDDPFVCESKEKELSPGPVVCANAAYEKIDRQDNEAVRLDSNPTDTDETPTDISESAERDKMTDNPESPTENDSNSENTEEVQKTPTSVNAATAIYTTNQLFTTPHGQQVLSSRENSRLTPVEFEMTDMDSQSRPGSAVQRSNRSSPITVKSVTPSPAAVAPVAVMATPNNERPSTQHVQETPIPSYEESQQFTSESQFRQFQREMFMLVRSPPPTYQSALDGQ